jgi:hypothetical protein
MQIQTKMTVKLQKRQPSASHEKKSPKDTNPVGTLILDFQNCKKYLSFGSVSQPVAFVVATWAS